MVNKKILVTKKNAGLSVCMSTRSVLFTTPSKELFEDALKILDFV